MSGAGLGVRLLLRARGAALVRNLLSVLGFALVSLLLLVVLALTHAGGALQDRSAAASPSVAFDGQPLFHARVTALPFRGSQWTTVFVAANDPQAPVPPGLDTFPGLGQTWVSPALRTLMNHDRWAAMRVPGQVKGTIDPAGLTAPDELRMVVGASPRTLSQDTAASGWGSPAGNETLVPTSGLLVTVLGLVGIPLVFLATTVSRLSSGARQRRGAALLLLGVPARTSARAVATEAALVAAVGSALGVTMSALVVPALAATGLLGLRWFATDTSLSPATAGLVMVAVSGLGGLVARTGHAREPLNPLGGAAEERVARRVVARVAVLVAALVPMALIIAVGASAPDAALATGPITALMLAAAATGVAGVVLCLPVALAAIGGRLSVRGGGLPALLAGRRLAADAPGSARAGAGIVLAVVTSVLGVAILVDLDSQNAEPPGGHVVSISFPRSTPPADVSGAMTVATPPRLALVPAASNDAETTTFIAVARCADLVRFLGHVSQNHGGACRDGMLYHVHGTKGLPEGGILAAGRGTPKAPDELYIRSVDSSWLADAPLVATESVETWAQSLDNGHLIAAPGQGEDVDRYISKVLSAAPTADIAYADMDTINTYRLPVIRRHVLGCIGLGVLVALGAYLIAVTDRARERRRDTTSLVVVGTPRHTIWATQALQGASGALTAGALGGIAASAVGASYLTLGGHHGVGQLTVDLLVLPAVVLGTVVLSALAALTTSAAPVRAEDLRRE